MANPILSEQSLKQAAQRSTPVDGATVWNPPVTDGPVTAWPVPAADAKVMTVRGTASATGVLFALLLVAAFFGWNAVETSSETGHNFLALPWSAFWSASAVSSPPASSPLGPGSLPRCMPSARVSPLA